MGYTIADNTGAFGELEHDLELVQLGVEVHDFGFIQATYSVQQNA